MAFDTLLVNGDVIDGTGGPRYRADVGVSDGKITAVGSLGEAEAERTFNVAGQVVAPGFIDMHTHSDVSMLDDPGGESKAHQGVTTEVTGNCGFSPFPAGKGGGRELQSTLGSILRTNVEWDWSSLDGWASRTEAVGTSLNLAPLVGHSALRLAVGLAEDRPPHPDELDQMRRLAAESVEWGAFGMSTGLTLAPSMYATTDEIVGVAEAIAPYDYAFYATHARVWAGWHLKAIEEAVEVGRRAGVPVQFSHIAIFDPRAYGKGPEMLAVIERARDEGIDVTCDMYPYLAASSGLSQYLPQWVQDGGVAAMLGRIRDPDQRRRARQDMAQGNFGGVPWTWDRIVVSAMGADANRDVVGRSLDEIAAARNEDPVETTLALIDEEDNHIAIVAHNRLESDVRTFMAHPQTMIGSDGLAISPTGAWSKDQPHPRFYGTFPRVLGYYVRDGGVLTLETAVYKMTGFPARRLGLRDRGRVAEGLVADLVVFDPTTVIDRATFDQPHVLTEGISHLLVNGVPVIADSAHTGARPGLVLRRAP